MEEPEPEPESTKAVASTKAAEVVTTAAELVTTAVPGAAAAAADDGDAAAAAAKMAAAAADRAARTALRDLFLLILRADFFGNSSAGRPLPGAGVPFFLAHAAASRCRRFFSAAVDGRGAVATMLNSRFAIDIQATNKEHDVQRRRGGSL